MNYNGKTAIVTGSSKGIGRAIAWQLGQAGANVVLNGRNGQKLHDTYTQFLEAGLNVSACQGDVSIIGDCKKLIEHAIQTHGQLDILVNNAGIGSRGFFEDTCPQVFRELLNVNVLGSIFPTMEALPHIKAAGGNILFISSLAGLRGIPNRCPYSMTKMAQTAVAESLRTELSGCGVHVGIVYVGITKNDPKKKIMVEDGSWSDIEDRDNFFVSTQDGVAKSVLNAIKNRQFKTILGANGKAYFFLQKFAPWLVDFTFRKSLAFIKTNDV